MLSPFPPGRALARPYAPPPLPSAPPPLPPPSRVLLCIRLRASRRCRECQVVALPQARGVFALVRALRHLDLHPTGAWLLLEE